MADTPQPGETDQVTPEAVDTVVNPPVDNGTPNTGSDVSSKDLEKAKLEAQMLRNKLDAMEKERQATLTKELTEKEDWRSLAERAQAEAEALRREKDEKEAAVARETATNDIFKDFDPKVVEAAKIAGLSSADSSDQSKEELKSKLEAMAKTIGATAPTVTGNNPVPPAPEVDEALPYVPVVKTPLANIEENRTTVARNIVTARKQLRNLKTLDMMREQSGFKRQEI